MKCECERGETKYRVSITKTDGELLDSAEFCQECMAETAVKRALDALGLQP